MIPEALKALPRWVGSINGSKLPVNLANGYPASVSRPDTWNTYEMVEMRLAKRQIDFPGFVFNGGGIVGIDIDAGYDEDGFMRREAAQIIRRFSSYTEKSRSGRGFHILVYGDLPFDGRNNRQGVEIYKNGRYFIMTGQTISFTEIQRNQEAIDWLVETHFPEVRVAESGKITSPRIYSPQWQRPSDGRIKLRPVYPEIPQGCRNICLTSLGGLMHNTGYDPDAIYDELCYANDVACKPALDLREIEGIVRSVTRYKR